LRDAKAKAEQTPPLRTALENISRVIRAPKRELDAEGDT
jgi:hypothetical protein